MPPDLPERIDRYRILDLLGRGSMGDVYLAIDPKFDRKMALKVMSTHRLGDDEEELEDLRQRFVQEALAAGRLNHPGIVTVYDADTDAHTGWPFIAMEWVDGRSLRNHLRADGPLPLDNAVALATDVALALDYAHDQGVVHRDIKPANLLLRSDGRVKVADFGVAKLVSSSLTLTGQVLGSPNYMSPEQVRAEPIDGRTDLFALGVVLYECLAGRPAFAADSLAGITFKIVSVDPRPVEIYNPDVPRNLSAVLGRMLEKEPAVRYQRGAELAEALRTIGRELEEASTSTRPATRELTLPAGMPDHALPRSPSDTRSLAGTMGTPAATAHPEAGASPSADADTPSPPSPDGDSTPLAAPPTARRRRRWASRLALLAVLAFALLFGARWVAESYLADLPELTERLGIFETRRGMPWDSEPLPPGGTPPELGSPGKEPESPDGIDDTSIPPNEGTAENKSDSEGDGESSEGDGESSEGDGESSEGDGESKARDGGGEEGDNGGEGIPADTTDDPADTTDDPADTTAAGPETEPESEIEAHPPPPPSATTRFRILLDNHLKLGYIAVWIDGRKIMTRRIETEGLMSRWRGEKHHFEVPVEVGEHRVEVHVSGLTPRVEAPGRIEGEFVRGRVETLEVEVDRWREKLILTWKDPEK